MTQKYHGTPITPIEQIMRMRGRNFCVPYPRPDDLKRCLQIAQSIMFDNGAFTCKTKGIPFDERGFYEWVEPVLGHPHWAVVPDVIDGSVELQREMTARWPFKREFGAPVWHLGLPIDYLLELSDEWPKVCFGSAGRYWNINSPEWCARMDEAFNALARHHAKMPWIHGLRMLGQMGKDWPLASADSTNVAQNFKRDGGCAECKAEKIDAVQCPTHWTPRAEQCGLFEQQGLMEAA